MARSRIQRALVAVTAVLVPLGALAAPAHAATATSSFATLVSGPGDYIGQGSTYIWQGAGSVTVSGSVTTQVTVGVTNGTFASAFAMNFAAAPGATLTPGVYENAQRTPFRDTGHPGIDITGDGRGCNTVSGRFTVLDAPADLSRLWLVYEEHCEGGTSAFFGEVRFNEPAADPDLLVAPDRVDWPATYPHVAARDVPITLVNTGSATVTVSSAAIASGSSDFSVVNNGCTTVAVGASCVITVRFTPSTSGNRSGALTISDSTSTGTQTVALNGTGIAGYTSWNMQSQPGDYIGGGSAWSYTPATATFSASGSAAMVTLGLTGANGDWWSAQFAATGGTNLTAGVTVSGATRYPFNGTGPGLNVDGNGRGCNTLTGSFLVHEIAFDGSGNLSAFSVSFEQHCEGGTAALLGSIAWHASQPAAPLPGSGPHASTLTLAVAPSPVVFGGSATLSGRLVDAAVASGVASQPIVLYSRPTGTSSWTYLSTVTTDSGGNFALSGSPAVNSDYSAVYYGSAGVGISTAGPVDVTVAPRVTIAVDHTTVKKNGSFLVTTVVTPNHAGQTVWLQVLTNGAWQNLQSVSLSNTSGASFTVSAGGRGTYVVRVLKPADSDHVVGSSSSLTLTVT